MLSMGMYPILERSQIYSLPSGPNATAPAFTSASLLPTPWEASFATLASNPTGSAQIHAIDTAQRHQLSQFMSSSAKPSSVHHRRSLASSAQDALQQTPWGASELIEASQRTSQLPEASELGPLLRAGLPGPLPASNTEEPADGTDSTGNHDEVLIGAEVTHKKLLAAAMRLGTVFSPTDNLAILHYLSPNTQPVLHSLLFGEGVMNDITAVIMLKTTALVPEVTWDAVGWSYWKFLTLFSASSVMGVSAGLLSAILTKRTLLCISPVRPHAVLYCTLCVCMPHDTLASTRLATCTTCFLSCSCILLYTQITLSVPPACHMS